MDKSIINWELHQKLNNKKSKIDKEINFNKLPDPKNHQLISFLKSAVRISGYLLLPYSITLSVIVLVVSELIGIIEELV
jgi:hypothetical protein